jgi:hypothetical protein
LKEIFEEHHGEMPKTGFFSGCEMPSPWWCALPNKQVDLTNFELKHIEFGVYLFVQKT